MSNKSKQKLEKLIKEINVDYSKITFHVGLTEKNKKKN